MTNLPKSLIDMPAYTAENFAGYLHFIDQTRQPFNTLAFPSINCSIPSFDKIVPDKGKTLYGQRYTENTGVVGNKERYKNFGGIEMEARVFKSNDNNLKDVIEVGFENDRMVFSGLSGSFTTGESVSGQTSGATANVVDVVGTVLFLTNIIGTFQVSETILGLTSSATATVTIIPDTIFHQITENVNPIPRGLHEYYFDSWFDTDLANNTNTTPALSKNLPRLIWVNGYRDNSNPVKGAVYSWTGGIAVITNFIVNTSISINPMTTWRSLGFTEDASGNAFVIINGVSHQVLTPANLDTSTITVSSTSGIAIGDVALSKIEIDVSPIPFDMCRQNQGYMFYGFWNSPDYYMSNAFNRTSEIRITNFQGGLLNDLILNPASAYTGTTESVYHIVIDSVTPDINEQTFISGGGGNLNDGIFTTTGYSVVAGVGGLPNTYSMNIIADFTLGANTVVGGSLAIGDTIVGASSQAMGIITAIQPVLTSFVLGVKMLTSISFFESETVNDSNSSGGNTIHFTSGSAIYHNWFQYTKNGAVVNTNTGFGSFPANIVITTPITLTDGLTFTFGNVTGHAVGDSFQLKIREGGIDTFQWQKDGGAFTLNIAITGGFQTLSNGIQIRFLNTNGHTLGDYWDVTAIPSITRAWDNFYYALPVRRPGEGYKYRLPSNFWTMDTQENSMYVNTSFGDWSVVTTTLSADLQSEAVSLTPLKQAGTNKVLYPYLTGHLNDDLIYINTDHNLNDLGRKPLLQEPQTGYLSDPVKLDFESSTFVGGRIKYVGKKLYISSPEDGLTHCYDTYKKYWNPPKSFSEVGILTIIDDVISCHSNVRNETFTMFTSSNGDNGQGYTVEIRTPYWSGGNIWNSKFSSMSFTEGYITGNPGLIHTVYEGVNGCGGIFPHPIEPIVCLAPDRAPFGEGSFGSHPNGSDLDFGGSYFNEIFKAYKPILQYYLISLGITCVAKSHTYSILSLGMNGMYSETGNNTLVNPSNKVPINAIDD